MSSIKLFRFIFFSTLIAIFYIATTPNGIEALQNIWDKLKHSFAFFTLFILFFLSYPKITSLKRGLILLLYGVSIEIVQYFIPTREFSFEDIFADLVGVLLGYLVIKVFKRYFCFIEKSV